MKAMHTFSCFVLTLCSSWILATASGAQCELETQELEPMDSRAGDGFGSRVARAGNVAIVASYIADDLGLDSGSATVWEREPGSIWKLSKKILASDGAAGDYFGAALAVDGASVLVGAPYHDHPATDCGAVYVFARDRGGRGRWGRVAHFTPPSAGAGAQFGYSLAVRGDRLLIGAPHRGLGVPGKAYLFRRDAGGTGGWALERELTSADPSSGFQFGQDVTLGEHLLAVSGALQDFLQYNDVVHVYAEDAGGAGNWGEVQRIFSPSGASKIDLDGDRLISVAPTVWIPGTNRFGALYLFRRDLGGPEGWGLERRIESATPGGIFAPDEVDLRGEWIVSGNGRSVTVFGRNVGGPGAWGQVTRIHDDDPSPEVQFGIDVQLEGSELFVGAAGQYSSTLSGSVYVYDLERLARASWRNDAARSNPDVYRVTGRPILGEAFRAEVDFRGTSHDRAVLVAFARPVEALLPGGQVLLGGRPFASAVATRGPAGRARFSFDLPPDPALCGRVFTTQAALVGGAEPFILSNAQDLVLGAP